MIIGIYFSGTGNTKHCVETFVKQYDNNYTAISIEDANVLMAMSNHSIFIFGYPVYFSNTPKIVQDFISNNKNYFKNKNVFVISTMGLFSGDGSGCAARQLKKCGATIIGGLHLKMPDCIGDEKLLKKSDNEKRQLIIKAENKIATAVKSLKAGVPIQDGLSRMAQMSGLFGQRLWFYGKTKTYKKKPNIDVKKCIGCGLCVKVCPMKNITLEDKKAVAHGRCTMCYRCFSNCPAKALTILGKKIYEQHLFEKT